MERLTQEQLQTLDLRLLEWYYVQSDTRHKDLVRVDDAITSRGYLLMTLYYAILSAAVGYVLTHLHLTDDLPLTYGCLSVIVFTIVAILYVCRVVWPHGYFAPGKEPERFAIPQYAAYFKGHHIDGEAQRKQVLGDELAVIQRKCEEQEARNMLRSRQLSTSILFLGIGSLAGVAMFLMAAFIL